VNLGDVAGGVDVDLELHGALNASFFGVGRVDDRWDAEGFVLDEGGPLGGSLGLQREE
jgi:hypothetical protein